MKRCCLLFLVFFFLALPPVALHNKQYNVVVMAQWRSQSRVGEERREKFGDIVFVGATVQTSTGVYSDTPNRVKRAFAGTRTRQETPISHENERTFSPFPTSDSSSAENYYNIDLHFRFRESAAASRVD